MTSRDSGSRPAPTATELLSALAELVDDEPGERPHRVLRRGVAAIGAAGAAARIIDAAGRHVDVATASPPAEATDLLARADGTGFCTSATSHGGAFAAVYLDVPVRGAVVFWFDEDRAFSDDERRFLSTLARMLAREVERSSLRVQREKLMRWAEALSDAFRKISSRASLSRVLDELARVSCEIPADYSAIRLLSADRRSLEFRALHHPDPVQGELLRAALAQRSMPADLGDTAHVLETGESMLVPKVDMNRLSRAYAGTPFGDYIAQHPLSSLMAVPLGKRGSVFGVVHVARVAPDPFQPSDLQFLQEVADRAVLALDTEHLLADLTRSEEKLRVALEAGRLGAWEWDIVAGRVSWSTMLEAIHGLESGAFPGTFEAYQQDIHPDDRELVTSTIARTVTERSEYHIVYRIIRPDGETRWLEANGRLFCDPDGAPLRLVGVCVDVSAQRYAEEKLREMLITLRDADQRKDQFLAMLAHELRNPLGPMVNATHLLGDPGLPADTATRAREILDRQVRHMARLLDDLLDVSRITRGKIETVREPVDVNALTREVVTDQTASFSAHGVALQLTESPESPVVHADRTRLAQVIGNLLSNAVKFSQHGQAVRVGVGCNPALVVLTVADDGAGIEPELLGRIFEPFVQADTSLSRARGGLGLGLAVVKGLVDLHGGHVSVASRGPGLGTEVRVELPRLIALPVAASSALGDVPPPGSPAAILVFEDNEDAAEMLCILLSTAGYRVSVEPTGRLAVEAVKRARPAVVLCDLGLPDRDGYEVAADIRADHELATLPLIAISGYGSVEDQARSRRAGFDLHLTKPISPAALLLELSRRITPDGRPVSRTAQ